MSLPSYNPLNTIKWNHWTNLLLVQEKPISVAVENYWFITIYQPQKMERESRCRCLSQDQKKKQKSVNLNMAGTRDSVTVNSRGRNVRYKQYYDKFVCLFIFFLFTPNLEKVRECNRRWLRKGPEVSLLDGISLTKTTTLWQLDQHATRQFLVLVAIEQTPARSHYGQNIEKILIPTPQHTS